MDYDKYSVVSISDITLYLLCIDLATDKFAFDLTDADTIQLN